jgi:hypothetical protein
MSLTNSELVVVEMLSKNTEYPEIKRTTAKGGRRHQYGNGNYVATVENYQSKRSKEIVDGLKVFLKKKGRSIRVRGRNPDRVSMKKAGIIDHLYHSGDLPLKASTRVDIYVHERR